ncbi:uncharacterized protein [Primulina eburnea]|uniref:uncharacterized protein isoform X3 n=1 Tax=Primulina eburnea TaxID=1245227 RepID=UPI003C6C1622
MDNTWELMDNTWEFRKICDAYCDTEPHVFHVGRATTHVNIDDRAYDVNRGAKLALSLYNRENQKNFNLVKVVKLNSSYACAFMTVCAQDGDSDECHLFRCVVNVLKHEVLLCEIKCTGEISMLVDNVDDYVKKLCQRDEDQPSDTCRRNDLRNDSALGSDGVIHVSHTIFRIMGEKSFSDLHEMCEDYLDPCLYNKCGTLTSVDVNCFDWVTEYAKSAINFYNKKEQKNFMLVKVEKLYSFVDPCYYCMTFWAQNGRSDEYRLFRAVCFKRDDEDDNNKICPNLSDYLKYLAFDDWDVDAVVNSRLAISSSSNTSDGRNDHGVGFAGGSDTGLSGGHEESLKY